MKDNITYGQTLNIIRNENAIKVLKVRIANNLKEIAKLREQNRKILGRE